MIAHEGFEGVYVGEVVERLVDGGFGEKGGVRGARVIQEAAKRLQADASPANVLVTVETGGALGFGVVAMPDGNVAETDGGIEVVHRLPVSGEADEVVSGDVGVAGVDAGGDGHERTEEGEQLGNLLEAAAKRILGAGGVLNQDGEAGAGEREPLGGLGDGGGGSLQTFGALCSTERAGMEDEISGFEGDGALDFGTKGGDGFSAELGIAAGDIDEIVGVNDERAQIVLAAEAAHRLALGSRELEWLPLARAGGEDLQGVAPEAVGALGGILHAAGSGGVDSDAARGELGRSGGRGD